MNAKRSRLRAMVAAVVGWVTPMAARAQERKLLPDGDARIDVLIDGDGPAIVMLPNWPMRDAPVPGPTPA